jgi:hypothetical protein
MPGFEKVQVGVKENVHGKIKLVNDTIPKPKIELIKSQ